MAGYSRIGIHPAKELEPGRYALDRTGRLHPIELSRFVKAVCIVTVRERKAEREADEEVGEEFSAAISRSAQARLRQVDFAKLAQRLREKPSAPPRVAAPPKAYARSREPCDLCGVPGFLGCSHQLAYEEWSA